MISSTPLCQPSGANVLLRLLLVCEEDELLLIGIPAVPSFSAGVSLSLPYEIWKCFLPGCPCMLRVLCVGLSSAAPLECSIQFTKRSSPSLCLFYMFAFSAIEPSVGGSTYPHCFCILLSFSCPSHVTHYSSTPLHHTDEHLGVPF
jgi:hypothetical protein